LLPAGLEALLVLQCGGFFLDLLLDGLAGKVLFSTASVMRNWRLKA